MIPRSNSIFTIGEEMPAIVNNSTTSTGQLPAVTGDLVGLRIIISCSIQKSSNCNIVAKSSSMNPYGSFSIRSNRPPAVTTVPELSFLKTCYLCKKTLNPKKDVYIYRGEHGFCTEKCRFRQILMDERKEFDALAKKRALKGQIGYRPVDPRRTGGSDGRRRVVVVVV